MSIETVPQWAQVSLYAGYLPGRSPGWDERYSRKVRIPFVTYRHALECFELAKTGESRISGLPDGVVPDTLRVVVEPRPNIAHPMVAGMEIVKNTQKFWARIDGVWVS